MCPRGFRNTKSRKFKDHDYEEITWNTCNLGASVCVMSLGCSGSSDDSGTDGGGSGTTTGNFKAECEKACDKRAASTCSKKPKADACKRACALIDMGLSANTDCSGTFAAEQACLNTKDIKCDSDGEPVVEGCDSEGKAALDCLAKYDSEYGCEAACKKLVPPEKCADDDYANEEACQDMCLGEGRIVTLCHQMPERIQRKAHVCSEQYRRVFVVAGRKVIRSPSLHFEVPGVLQLPTRRTKKLASPSPLPAARARVAVWDMRFCLSTRLLICR